jgi:integrase
MAQALERAAGILSSGAHGWESLPWPSLGYQHVARLRAMLIEDCSPATANKILAAVRGALRECWRLGYVTAEHYHRAADIKGIRAERLPRGRKLPTGEMRALAEACATDSGAAGARDAALLAVLGAGGLRRAEAVALELADYTQETGELRVIGGKGRKDRTTYLQNGAASAITDWLAVRGLEPGPLFCPVNKGGRVQLRRMTSQAIYNALEKRRVGAGVRPFSPHDMRRTFISELLDAGADIVTVQRLAGHARPETTARYDHRGEETKRKATALLHFPHIPRTGA